MSKITIIFAIVLMGVASTICYPSGATASSDVKGGIDQYALVIGVANYQHMPSVPYALKNAQQVAQVLEANHYKVTVLQDPSSTVLKEAFDRLTHQVGKVPARRIVVYYCGQAESQTMADGQRLGWIIPIDCPVLEDHPDQFSQKAISTKMLSDFSRKMRSRYMIMLFDAAFAADMFSLKTPKISSFNPKNIQPVRQFIVAGGANQSMPKKRLFADALIKALEGEADIFLDRYITGTELAVFLDNRLAQATKGRLKLQYGKMGDSNSGQGEFFFQQTEAIAPGTLFVQCRPENARIKILNIKPTYYQGMPLSPGRYQLKVTANGYITQTKNVIINTGREVRLKFELEKSKSQTVNSLGMTFRWIDKGRYRMGSEIGEFGRRSDEQRHWVNLTDGFWMQTNEVTVLQFKRFISQTGYVTEAQKNGGCWSNQPGGRWRSRSEIYWESAGQWMNAQDETRDQYPVTCVSWNDAVAFARWLSGKEGKLYRLPTEQQWEVACRAGTSTPFYTGQCLKRSDANYSQQAETYGTCTPLPHLVASKMLKTGGRDKNPWGLSDMHGNAAEWCLDRYGPYDRVGQDSSQELLRNTERIIRGGHFDSPADQCRSASRSSFRPGFAANVIGFRLTLIP